MQSEDASLDALDLNIITFLQNDGRARREMPCMIRFRIKFWQMPHGFRYTTQFNMRVYNHG